MPKSQDKIRNRLKYSARRPYFGVLTGRLLNDTYQALVNREYGDSVDIKVGKINGDVICGALWREMSLNPDFFGTVSPFIFNGVNNIFRFVESDQTNPVIKDIRRKLVCFLNSNAGQNRQWNDVIKTDNAGYVYIYDTRSGIYRALQLLRDCIKLIAKQNVSDYDSGHRASITAAVRAESGNTTKGGISPLPAPTKVQVEHPVASTYIDDETEGEERERELLETFTTGHADGLVPDVWQEYMQRVLLSRQH